MTISLISPLTRCEGNSLIYRGFYTSKEVFDNSDTKSGGGSQYFTADCNFDLPRLREAAICYSMKQKPLLKYVRSQRNNVYTHTGWFLLIETQLLARSRKNRLVCSGCSWRNTENTCAHKGTLWIRVITWIRAFTKEHRKYVRSQRNTVNKCAHKRNM